MSPQRVHSLTQTELNQIINLHLKILDESVLNKFGPKFLALIYKSAVKDDVVIVAKKDSKIIGYLVATSDVNSFYSKIIKDNLLTAVPEVFKTFFKSPLTVLRVFMWTLNHPQIKTHSAELQFIAVDPNDQNQGLGTKLIKALNDEFKRSGVTCYRVGTKKENLLSNSFYKKLNFQFLDEEEYLGARFNYYLSPELR